jgi:hypothetical protein
MSISISALFFTESGAIPLRKSMALSVFPDHRIGMSNLNVSLRDTLPFIPMLNRSLHFFTKWYQSRIIPMFLYQLNSLMIGSFTVGCPSVKN